MGRLSFFAMSLAGASVALVILVDLATGQGPPILNAYMSRVPPPEFRQPLPPPPPGLNYMPPRGEFESKDKKGDHKESDKLEKEFKEDKEGYKSIHNPYPGKKYEEGYGYDKSTPAPGVLSSFQNHMSDAWKSLTNLGHRSKRDAENSENSESLGSSESPVEATSAARSLDELESRTQYGQQGGYIFFKVPRHLVCV